MTIIINKSNQPEEGDQEGEREAVDPNVNVDEVRQDDAASEADVVDHGKDEEVARHVDEQDRVEDDVDDDVGEKDVIDGSAEAFASTIVEEMEEAKLKNKLKDFFTAASQNCDHRYPNIYLD
jgi:hypothetical protein